MKISDHLKNQRLDELSHFGQVFEKQRQDEMDQQLALYPEGRNYIVSKFDKDTAKRGRGRMTFLDKIKYMQNQQMDRSTCLNQEMSAISNEVGSSTVLTSGPGACTDILELKQYFQLRPELKYDYGLKLRMNAGENIMYDVRPELQ